MGRPMRQGGSSSSRLNHVQGESRSSRNLNAVCILLLFSYRSSEGRMQPALFLTRRPDHWNIQGVHGQADRNPSILQIF